MKRRPAQAALLAIVGAIGSIALASPAAAADISVERRVEPVVILGAQLTDWSTVAADGVSNPHNPTSTDRDAHNGSLTVPVDPAGRTGAPVDQIAAYSWRNGDWQEVPVQVDERFPYFLTNGRSDFGIYSGTDKELSYEWDIESWKKMAGECQAQYPAQDETMMPGFPTQDPVTTLDDDDEVVVMASDAGEVVPTGTLGPPGTGAERYEISFTDPLNPLAENYVYLFQSPQGSSFDSSNGYVHYERDANADQWIDRNTFTSNDPEKLGSSNTGYGPNLEGTVCDPNGTVRASTDRFPRDGLTVTTDSYKWRATGRWMIRGMHVAKPGQPGVYGPDLIDRWKGRAFQQSPASSISLVGFEDEQVNWEANSALLGERMGPVRAIRETWGADSGTNTTKTEYFYRDSIAYRYKVRVHPIPPDGLYTSWDYNHEQVSTYYNELMTEDDAVRPGGVAIDGVNDDVGQVDSIGTFPAFFDTADPTFTKPLSILNWEQVSGAGDNGSLVYLVEIKNAQALENPAVVPYYRDDACFDDGTGDGPSPHPHPGDPYTTQEQEAIPCYTEAPEGYSGPYRQGAFGSHGIHFFFTNDTDNSFSPERTTEIDAQQWQWAVPTAAPHAVGDRYANTAKAPLVATGTLQASTPGKYPAAIAVSGALSGQTTDEATLAATLTSKGQPLAGQDVIFQLDNKNVARSSTGADGVATAQVTLSGPARQTPARVIFPGDDSYKSAEQSYTFEVTHEDTTMSLSLQRIKTKKTTATAGLRVADSGGALAGKTVHFLVNGVEISSAQTDSKGIASVVFTAKQARLGQVVRAEFETDDTYVGSAAEQAVPRRLR